MIYRRLICGMAPALQFKDAGTIPPAMSNTGTCVSCQWRRFGLQLSLHRTLKKGFYFISHWWAALLWALHQPPSSCFGRLLKIFSIVWPVFPCKMRMLQNQVRHISLIIINSLQWHNWWLDFLHPVCLPAGTHLWEKRMEPHSSLCRVQSLNLRWLLGFPFFTATDVSSIHHSDRTYVSGAAILLIRV